MVRTRPSGDSPSTCIGCGYQPHDGGRKNCPAYKETCRNCGKIGHFSRVCRQKPATTGGKQRMTTMPQTHTLSTQPRSYLPFIQFPGTSSGLITHTPTITMKVTMCNGQENIAVLPDSGADICAAGPQFVEALGEHMDNLADSDVVINGSTLHPIGKISNVSFHTHGRTTKEDVHIFDSVAGAVIS